jgi:dienelactone hydrolase
VTCFYAILNPESGTLRYANAGHDLPYLWHGGDKAQELRARGMPLGLIPEMSYEEIEAALREKDRVLFYSDGLVETAQEPGTQDLRVGYFVASTGAGAALATAAKRPDAVGAVVSRGGRPDLAGKALSRVVAPTLLIVGGEDGPVIGMNREATEQIRAEKRLEVVPGATHLFKKPGKLEEVARPAAG